MRTLFLLVLLQSMSIAATDSSDDEYLSDDEGYCSDDEDDFILAQSKTVTAMLTRPGTYFVMKGLRLGAPGMYFEKSEYQLRVQFFARDYSNELKDYIGVKITAIPEHEFEFRLLLAIDNVIAMAMESESCTFAGEHDGVFSYGFDDEPFENANLIDMFACEFNVKPNFSTQTIGCLEVKHHLLKGNRFLPHFGFVVPERSRPPKL